MSRYCTVKIEDDKEKVVSEVNQNKITTARESGKEVQLPCKATQHIQSYAAEVIQLPNDGRVEIVASRRFGRPVQSRRSKDEVTITLDQDDTIHVVVAAEGGHSGPDVLRRCGARIPHGPAVLDLVVSGPVFVYAFLLTVLVAHMRGDWKYTCVMMLWFFYVILRINTFKKQDVNTLQRDIWHFSGISFGIIFMYATIIVVFPMLTRDAFHEASPTNSDARNMVLPALKASVGFTLLGMAARRSFHCGKIVGHTDVIKSVLLDNVDIFNLVETLGLTDGRSPMIPKGSIMEICILLACEVAFLVIALEALMPYSLMALDKKTVGRTRHNISHRQSKEQAILMVYPYSLLVQNVPFLVIRLALFAQHNTFQLGYVIKNITSIVFGAIALIRARSSLEKDETRSRPVFSLAEFQHRRVSI